MSLKQDLISEIRNILSGSLDPSLTHTINHDNGIWIDYKSIAKNIRINAYRSRRMIGYILRDHFMLECKKIRNSDTVKIYYRIR